MGIVGYFMIRVDRADPDSMDVSGILERLDAGQKATFRSGQELLRLLAGWDSAVVLREPLGGMDEQLIPGSPHTGPR